MKLKRRVVLDYLNGKSLSILETDFNVSDTTILNWATCFSDALPKPHELNKIFDLHKRNNWNGVLLVDGKVVKTQQGNYVELLAVDFKTEDLIAILAVSSETTKDYARLITLVEKSGYVIKALVSDAAPSILSLTQPLKEKRKLTRKYLDCTPNLVQMN